MSKTAKKRRFPQPEACQAVGTQEAAALMGVHFSTPRRMVDKGMIGCSLCRSRTAGALGERLLAIFDGAECERNYLEYEENLDASGGKTTRRPRQYLSSRPAVLRHLAKVKDRIAFADAIAAADASEILGVHPSFLVRMVKAGEIVGRPTWGRRTPGSGARNWIFSRASCQDNVRRIRAEQSAGTKTGRPRKLS